MTMFLTEGLKKCGKNTNRQAAPAVANIDGSNFETFKNSDRVVVVAYLSPDDEVTKAELTNAAEKMRDDYFFGIVTDETLAKEHKIETFPSLVVYKQFDEGRNDHVGSFTEQQIQEFVKTNSVPLMDEIDAENFGFYAETGRPLAFLFAESKEQAEPLIEAIKPVAEKHKGKINFVHIDASKYGGYANNLALKQEWPAFAIQHIDTGAKFPFDQNTEITTANIEKFVDDYAAGKIQPTLKSEPAPAENNGPVKVVVANEFNDIVLDKKKDVFLEVYAPWCGHCKRLAPTWTELGEAVEQQGLKDKLVIAKMDGTENDIPEEGGFTVRGFPTLKFFKAETNEVVDYAGDRSLEDLVAFVNEHGSNIKLTVDGEEEKDESAHDEL